MAKREGEQEKGQQKGRRARGGIKRGISEERYRGIREV